jgi:glucose-1-phosphate cytidylyltransferase
MKAVILAGGSGTRLSEETGVIPKPLIEIGGNPILLHIMQIYSNYGINEFVILVGYKGHLVKEFFLNYIAHVQDISIDLRLGETTFLDGHKVRPNWKIKVIDTGASTMTGGRLLRVKHMLENESHFALTYGDGVADIDIAKLEAFHLASDQIATVTAVRPPGRFGALEIKNARVTRFVEKPLGDKAFINGGFFIFKPRVFNYLTGDDCVLEQEPLQRLALENNLGAYVHDGFWQCMDTLRDKQYLDALCRQSEAPWMRTGGVVA